MNERNPLQELWSRVEEFRHMMRRTAWVHPDPDDCLRFAVTEVAEALDAWLRVKGGFARNRTGDKDVHAELADCAIMLLSAVRYPDHLELMEAKPKHIDAIVSLVGEVFDNTYELTLPPREKQWERQGQYYPLNYALSSIYTYEGMELEAEIDRRLARIAHKHGQPPGHPPGEVL